MKIHYKVHIKKEDGSLGDIQYRVSPDEKDNLDAEPTLSDFTEKKEAQVWLLEELRLHDTSGKYEDYIIQGYDENDDPVEEVDEKDREAAAADARWIVANNPDVQLAFNTMLAARQMYTFGFIELEQAMTSIEQVDQDKRAPHPLALEVIIQACTRSSGKEFKAEELFQRLGSNIFPWMNHIIRKNILADEKDKKEDRAAADKKRREVRVPIGIKIDPEDDGLLDRTKPLILVGYGPAVKFLLDHAVTQVLAARHDDQPQKLFVVVRFDEGSEKRDNHDQMLRISGDKWINCCRSQDKLGEFAFKYVAPHLNLVPDLLVVDDLAAAYTLGHMSSKPGDRAGGYAPVRLAEANKRLSRWRNHAGMGMLAGVMTNGVVPIDCSLPELENLRTYCTVRPVSVYTREMGREDVAFGKSRIVVGKNAWYVDVDSEILIAPSKIIT